MAKILLISLGSRGDMEPFLALGEELLQKGDEVGCCMPAQFKSLAQQISPNFYPQNERFLELIEGKEIKKILGQEGSGFSRLKSLLKLMRITKPIQQQMILDQEKAVNDFKPDQIIFHIKCIYPVIWSLHRGGSVKLLSPMPALLDPVHNEPHISFGKPRFKIWNTMTYALAEYALIHQSILNYGSDYLKKHQIQLPKRVLKSFYRNSLQVEYAIDKRLFPKPSYWPERAIITKFRERKKSTNYTPDSELVNFLEEHPFPLYIGFGSMVNVKPKQIALDVLAVCEKLQIPVLLNESWGGIECPEILPSWAFKINSIPFHYLFPKMGWILHHGGSGTTHSALIHQKPQAIIPHIADQFFWNRQIEKMGVGIRGFKIKKWNRSRLEKLIFKLQHLQL